MGSAPADPAAQPTVRALVDCHELQDLDVGWQAASSAAGSELGPAGIDSLAWLTARVPGTAAQALSDARLWSAGDPHDFDAEDWWFRTSFEAQPIVAGEEVRLCLDGIATVAEVYLNRALVLESNSMFTAHALDVSTQIGQRNELAICCRALGPLLQQRRRPRARWRTRLVAEGNLRFFRTMLLGRLPGIAPGPPAVGPWRPVRLERRRQLEVQELVLRPTLDGEDGRLSTSLRLCPFAGADVSSVEVELSGPSGTHRAQLALDAQQVQGEDLLTASGELVVPEVARWWPHTHGEPALHDVRLLVGSQRLTTIDAGSIGFRELAFGGTPEHEVERDGLDLRVNGVSVFARGAVWTPIDPIGLSSTGESLRAALIRVRDAGMNMLRIPGTGAYETAAFHGLCDELGILVWQDFMFANLDYPIADEEFRLTVTNEAKEVLTALSAHPSLVVLCGNSEVEQQVAMTGLDSSLGRGELFGELLPALIAERAIDALYVPSAPCGGDVPFRPDRGISTYYGVGCYRLPLENVRRAGVRFAAECLAFSHIPAEATIDAMWPQAPGQLAGHHPRWKAGIPRENEADWDFEDVRDYYLKLIFGVDAAELRWVDHARYLQLSRALTGEIFAEVFGEWRRAAAPCAGALVLWLHDLLPGAGWGLVDHRGVPKLAYHHVKRALAQVAVWTTDEQLGGIAAHVANDGPAPLAGALRVRLYRDREHLVGEGVAAVDLKPHSCGEWNVEAVIGHFVDASWSYRFGPPAQDAIVVSLLDGDGEDALTLARAMRFPAGRPLDREPQSQLGLFASASALADGEVRLTLSSTRLAYGVEIYAPGFLPDDDGFSIEPGGRHVVTLRPIGEGGPLKDGRVGALNMSGRVKIVEAAAPGDV